MNVWVLAARPKTLIAAISPVMIGTVIARTEKFSVWVFLFTLLTVIGVQIATNFANDYFDFLKGSDTKKRLGPQRVTAAGLVKPSQMKKAVIVSLITTFCLGLYLIYVGGMEIALLLILSLILAVMYTKGKYAIAYLGLGEIFVFFFFGPVATTATYYLQTKEVISYAVLAGISPGALSTCILLINNIRDFEEDKVAHKNTLVVRFGRNFGKMLYAALLMIGTLFPLVFFKDHPYVAITACTIFPALFPLRALFRTTHFNLETAVGARKEMQYFESEALPKGVDHSQMVKATPFGRAYGSKNRVYLPHPTAVSRLNPLLAKTAQILLLFTLIFCATWNM